MSDYRINNILATFTQVANYLFIMATTMSPLEHKFPNGRQNLLLPGNLHEILMQNIQSLSKHPDYFDEYTFIEKIFPNLSPRDIITALRKNQTKQKNFTPWPTMRSLYTTITLTLFVADRNNREFSLEPFRPAYNLYRKSMLLATKLEHNRPITKRQRNKFLGTSHQCFLAIFRTLDKVSRHEFPHGVYPWELVLKPNQPSSSDNDSNMSDDSDDSYDSDATIPWAIANTTRLRSFLPANNSLGDIHHPRQYV